MDLATEVSQDAEFSKRYELGQLLGEGGMGTVLRGLHRMLDRPVAVKFMRPELLLEEDARKRFLSEARTAASLIHPNVCVVLDFGFAGRVPFLVTELVEGQSLQEMLRAGRIPPERVLAMMKEILDGLEAIHALSIVHRDLKPANILLTREGRPKILDFGLAKAFTSDGVVPGATLPGMIVGTPAYMSPEQSCADPLSPASDLYSLAVVLYEMVVGRLPFASDSYLDMMKMHRFDPPPIPPELLEPAQALFARGLAKPPRERFPSAAAFRAELAALERVVSGAGGFYATRREGPDSNRTVLAPPANQGLTFASSPAAQVAPVSPVAFSEPVAPPVAPPAAPVAGTSSAATARTAALVGLALLVGALALRPPPAPAPSPVATSATPPPVSTASPPPWTESVSPASVAAPVHIGPADRFRELERSASRRSLQRVNKEIFELRSHQRDKIGGLAARLVPANPVATGLDFALVDLLEMSAGTPGLAVSSPNPVGNWELLIKESGAHVAARRFRPLARLLEDFIADPASAAPPRDPLGLHRGTAFDWLHGAALMADPAHIEDVHAAVTYLTEAAEAHPAQPLGAWAAELLSAFYGRGGMVRAHEHFRTLAAQHRAALGPAGFHPFPRLEEYSRAAVARVVSGWGGRLDLAPPVLKAAMGRRQAAHAGVKLHELPH